MSLRESAARIPSGEDQNRPNKHRLESKNRLKSRQGLLATAVAAGTAALLLTSGNNDPQPNHVTSQPNHSPSQPSRAEVSPDRKPPVTLPAHGPYIGPDVAQRQQDFKNPALSAKENMDFGLFDPEQLKRDGVSYEIAKASQGLTYVDGYFAENRRRAEEAGLLFGAYHYMRAGNGAAQADFFHEQLEQTGGTDGVMMMVDVEWVDEAETEGPSYEDVTDFTERLHELVPDRDIILYTYSSYWGNETKEGRLGNPEAPEGTVLNWASYIDQTAPIHVLADKVAAPDNPSNPYIGHQVGTYKSYFFRQYTSTAVYDQYQGQHLDNPDVGQSTVDMNITFATRDELLRLAGRLPDGTVETR